MTETSPPDNVDQDTDAKSEGTPPTINIKPDQDSAPPPRRSSRVSRPPDRFIDEQGRQAVMAAERYEGDLPTYEDAMMGPDADKWSEAIRIELETLDQHDTWEFVQLPRGSKTIGNKWVLKIKRDGEGRIAKYKARLVAKGFSQQMGVNYFDTYSPTARTDSMRTMLAVAAHKGLRLHQLDVKAAYLNGDFLQDEEIYMDVPEGVQALPGTVCKLNAPLYGLKRLDYSARRWIPACTYTTRGLTTSPTLSCTWMI